MKYIILVTCLIFFNLGANAKDLFDKGDEFFQQNADKASDIIADYSNKGMGFAESKTSSASHKLLIKLTSGFDEFVRNMYPRIIEAFRNLFIVIASFFLIAHFVKWLLGLPDIRGLGKLVIATTLMAAIAFNTSFYIDYIYIPCSQFVINLPSWIIKLATSTKINGLIGLFYGLDTLVFEIKELAYQMSSQSGVWKGLWITIESGALRILYLILKMMFIFTFVLSVWAVNIFLLILPFGILFYSFEGSRGILTNILKSAAGYALTPFFASIVMSFTLFLTKDIVSLSMDYTEAGKSLPINSPQFEGFFTEAIIIAVISILMIRKSGQFANELLQGAIGRTASLGGALSEAAGYAKGMFKAMRGGGGAKNKSNPKLPKKQAPKIRVKNKDKM